MSDWFSTRRLGVTVHLTDGRTLSGEIHLQPVARHHSGPETATDLLNREELFFALMLDGELPPDRLRALDFLNSSAQFFPLRTGNAVRVLNRNHVRTASPLVDIKRGTA